MESEDREFQQHFAQRCLAMAESVYKVYSKLDIERQGCTELYHSGIIEDFNEKENIGAHARLFLLCVEILKEAEDALADAGHMAVDGFKPSELARERTANFLKKRDERKKFREQFEKQSVKLD